MDTKLKNSKIGKYKGILFVAVAALLFVSLFPWFEREVKQNDAQDEERVFESEEFINVLLKSNYVLYKDVMDKSGKNYTLEELYVEIKEEEAKNQPYVYDYDGEGEILQNSEENVKGIYKEQIEGELETIRRHYTDGISIRMDYYVVDNSTGTVLKNTSQSIEKLVSGTQVWENPYDYYVVLEYDSKGILASVNVRGKNAESFLKQVQLLASSRDALLLEERDEREQYLLVEDETIEKRIIFNQKKPENVTFVYAMTKEQMDLFFDTDVYDVNGYMADLFRGYSYEEIFYSAGVGNVCMLFLVGMAVLVLADTVRGQKAGTIVIEEKSKPSLEVLGVIGIIVFAAGSELAVTAAANSYQDYYITWIDNLIPPMHLEGSWFYGILEWIINCCIFVVLFGIWYWCLQQLKGMVNGVGAYVKQRSILLRSWKRFLHFIKRECRKFKEELLDADLAKDNKKLLIKLIVMNFAVLAIICCFWGMGIPILVIYSFVLYGLFKKYLFKIQSQYGKLLEATNSIAEGKLNNTFEEDFGVFESYKDELYKIQGGFCKAVDEEVKSQRMKTELITNVSHDLKTPLTAIITYIELLKEENITEEQRKEYLDTLDRKSMRLKVLIEDLFEVSKANSGNVKMEPVPVDICNLLRQVYLEHEEKMKEMGFDVRFDMPEEKVILQLDSQKTYRIFENLYVNVIKYAMPGTRVYVNAAKCSEKGIHIEIKNMSAQEITINPQDLTERFVRGDKSRNTEGSGLGLAIAKSFTELQGGKFAVETDGDLFKVIIEW